MTLHQERIEKFKSACIAVMNAAEYLEDEDVVNNSMKLLSWLEEINEAFNRRIQLDS